MNTTHTDTLIQTHQPVLQPKEPLGCLSILQGTNHSHGKNDKRGLARRAVEV